MNRRILLYVLLIVLFNISSCLGQHAWNTLLYNQVSGQHQLHYQFERDTSSLFQLDLDEVIIDSTLMQDRKKLVLSTGGMGTFFGNSLSLDDLSYIEDGIRYIDFDLSKEKVKQANIFGFESQINFLHFDYRLGRGAIRGGYTYRTFGNIDFDQEFFTLLSDGNEPFIGNTVEIGPKVQVANYHQFYLGYSGNMDGLSYTLQAKFLSGVSHLESDQSSIILSVSDDIYQLTFSNFYRIQTSKILKYNEIDDTELNFSTLDFSKPFKGNYGLGFDFGLAYTFDDDHRLFINAFDVGSISWTNLSRTYTSEGEISYEGLDIVAYLDADDSVALADSLRALLEVSEDLSNYSATIPTQVVLGVDYKLSEANSLSLIVAGASLAGGTQLMTSLSGRRKFSNKLEAGLSYTYVNGVHGVGLNGLISLGKIKIVFATDHVPAVFNITGSRMTNARGGLSLAF